MIDIITNALNQVPLMHVAAGTTGTTGTTGTATAGSGNLTATHAGTVISNLVSTFSTLALGLVTGAFGGAMGYHVVMHHISTDRSESADHIAKMKGLIAPTAVALGATGIAGYIHTLVK